MSTPIQPLPGFADPVSSWTHLAGAGLSLVLPAVLARRGTTRAGRFAAWVLGLSGGFALAMSGVYHMLAHGGMARAVFQRLDHAGIFVLIAGTFTALHLALFRGLARWGVIALLWALAATAIPLKVVFFAEMPEALSLAAYIGMGWLGVLSAIMIVRRGPRSLLRPLVAGGLAYTVGAVAEYLRAPTLWPGVVGPHELFHAAVLLGLAYHWRLLYLAITFAAEPRRAAATA